MPSPLLSPCDPEHGGCGATPGELCRPHGTPSALCCPTRPGQGRPASIGDADVQRALKRDTPAPAAPERCERTVSLFGCAERSAAVVCSDGAAVVPREST